MIDVRRFQAGEWLLVALAVIGLWLVFMPKPMSKTCVDAKTVTLVVGDVVWRIPSDLQPQLVSAYQEPEFPTVFEPGRGYRYCRPEQAPAFALESFHFKRSTLEVLAARDPARFGAISRVDPLWVRRVSLMSRKAGPGQTYGPLFFGQPTVVRCQAIKSISGRDVQLCRLAGWMPDGTVMVQLTYTDKLEDGAVAAVEALMRDLSMPGRQAL